MSEFGKAIFLGSFAYLLWGLLPLYWQLIDEAGAFEILAHRGIWSAVVCVALLALRKQVSSTLVMVKEQRTLLLLLLASGFLTLNWVVYIWSVIVDRVVEAALGYYITPLINVAAGVFLLRERLRPLQWTAVTLAFIGVAVLTVGFGSLPWIALVLSISWSSYSLIKKKLNLGALETLSVETLFAFLPNFVYLIWLESNKEAFFGEGLVSSLLLFGAGIATVAPLLLFNGSTTRLPLSTVGLLQYITPTIMLFIGVFLNGEDMAPTKLLGFTFIWAALAFLSVDIHSSRIKKNQINLQTSL